MIICQECKRNFEGDPITPGNIFVCRFCMGDGIDPKKFNTNRGKTEREIRLERSLKKLLVILQVFKDGVKELKKKPEMDFSKTNAVMVEALQILEEK